MNIQTLQDQQNDRLELLVQNCITGLDTCRNVKARQELMTLKRNAQRELDRRNEKWEIATP